MSKAQQYLDFINLMTYDYGWGTTGHHTNLYSTLSQPEDNAAHHAVQAFLAAGVPAKMLVVGLAFYGRGCTVEDTVNNGFGQKTASTFYTSGYTFIKDSIMHRDGFVRYWDATAQASYLFNAKDKIFISYDDEDSCFKLLAELKWSKDSLAKSAVTKSTDPVELPIAIAVSSAGMKNQPL